MIYYMSNAELPSKDAHTIQQMRMCEAFVENGEEVCFVHPSYGLQKDTTSWDELSNYYGLESRFTIRTVASFSDSSWMIPDIPEGLFKILSVNRWLLHQVSTGKISGSDLIYSRLFYPVGIFAEWYGLIPNSRRPTLIQEYHNPLESPLEDRIFDNVDGTVCITEQLKSRMLSKARGSNENIFVAHDGVDLSKYNVTKSEARDDLDIPQNSEIVMYTGHLYPRKGVHVLVEAADQINAEVMIIGGYKEDIKRIKEKHRLSDSITFVGFVDPSKIHKYQISSDILIAPYTNDAWMPSPLKIFEYMAANSPIVASQLPTIEEVLRHRQNALLTPPSDSNALAESINELLNNKDLMNDLRSTARQEVESFTWSKRVEGILEFVEEIRGRS